MKYFTLIIYMVFLNLPNLCAQDVQIPVNYYFSTNDFTNHLRSNQQIMLIVKRMGDEYIWAKKILDLSTGTNSKTGNMAWAIEYNDQPYFHLRYSYYSGASGYFVKFSVIGRICLAILDPASLQDLDNARNSYGGGLTGALLKESGTWGGNYFDKNGNKKKIYFIDTKNLTISLPHKANNAAGDFLTKATLKKLIGKHPKKDISEYSVEDIVEIVNEFNIRMAPK